MIQGLNQTFFWQNENEPYIRALLLMRKTFAYFFFSVYDYDEAFFRQFHFFLREHLHQSPMDATEPSSVL